MLVDILENSLELFLNVSVNIGCFILEDQEEHMGRVVLAVLVAFCDVLLDLIHVLDCFSF